MRSHLGPGPLRWSSGAVARQVNATSVSPRPSWPSPAP